MDGTPTASAKGNAMYVIAWKSKLTGYSGRGYAPLLLETAKRACAELNADYPELEHWPEAIQTQAAVSH